MAVRRLGQIFVDLGFITDDQQEMLVEEQSQNPGQLIGRIAEDMGLISDDQLIQALGEQFGLQTIDIEGVTPPAGSPGDDVRCDGSAVSSDSAATQRQRAHVGDLRSAEPVDAGRTATVPGLRHPLAGRLGNPDPQGASTSSSTKMSKASKRSSRAEQRRRTEGWPPQALGTDGPINLSDVTELVDSAPVRKLLNMVLLLAIKDHASDIHFEPFEDEFRIRIKADGVLFEMVPPPRHLAFAITTRIKVMANLDISERRLPQDGRIELMVGGHPVDLRVSVLPTMFGESVVCRVLDRSVVSLDLNNVGMDDGNHG